jgi:hypothetical protein
MTIRPALRNILKVVCDLSDYDVTTNVVDIRLKLALNLKTDNNQYGI